MIKIELSKGHYYILYSEKATGIIIDKLGNYQTNGDQDYYDIFHSLKQAKEHAQLVISKGSQVEVSIYDHQGNYITGFD